MIEITSCERDRISYKQNENIRFGVIRGFVRLDRGGRPLLRGLGSWGCSIEIFQLLGDLVSGFLAFDAAILAWYRLAAGRLGLFRN